MNKQDLIKTSYLVPKLGYRTLTLIGQWRALDEHTQNPRVTCDVTFACN